MKLRSRRRIRPLVPGMLATLLAVLPMTTLAAPPTEPASLPAEAPVPWKRWRLFDPFVAPRELVWHGGPASLREVDRAKPFRGAAFGVAETIRETRGFVWLSLQRNWELRVHSKWTFVPILRYVYEGGFRLGGLELGGGPTLIPLTPDYSDGKFSFGGMSPGATARVGFKTGAFRISLRGAREYLWRWFGQPSAVMDALTMELAVEQPRPLRRGSHPIVLER